MKHYIKYLSYLTSEHHNTLNGIFFACLFALSSFYIASISWVSYLGLSPLVIAILLGMAYGSTLRKHLPHEWTPGIQWVAKKILRIAIVLYGFRLTFQDIFHIGITSVIIDTLVVFLTLGMGTFVGTKILKIDRDTSILISSGAAICGAAAVLAAENVLKSEPYKAAFAVISVVLFGTLSMFIYPALQHANLFHFNDTQFGIFAGATIHEVAQVVVAGSQISPTASSVAIIVKMTRVMLLAPMLVILGMMLSRHRKNKSDRTEIKPHKQLIANLPWFALGFVCIVALHSLLIFLHWFPSNIANAINTIDTFLLTLAMAALGIETNFSKIKAVGTKPILLAFVLFIWLASIGYLLLNLLPNAV